MQSRTWDMTIAHPFALGAGATCQPRVANPGCRPVLPGITMGISMTSNMAKLLGLEDLFWLDHRCSPSKDDNNLARLAERHPMQLSSQSADRRGE